MTRRLGVVAAAVVAVATVPGWAAPSPAAVRWQPKPGLRRQYQHPGTVNRSP